jgi:hypothetical protein
LSLPSRIYNTTVLCLFFSFGMAFLSIVSLATFIDWAKNGTFSLLAGPGICLVFELVLIVGMSYVTIPTAMAVVAFTGTKDSLRAMYVMMLWPVIFATFMFGNAAGLFVNAYVFGWPLFIASALSMPYAAYTLRREATVAALVRAALLRCYSCNQLFYIERTSPRGFCPHCHCENENTEALTSPSKAHPALVEATHHADVLGIARLGRRAQVDANALGGPDFAGLLEGHIPIGKRTMHRKQTAAIAGILLFLASLLQVALGGLMISLSSVDEPEFLVSISVLGASLACVYGSLAVIRDRWSHLGLVVSAALFVSFLPTLLLEEGLVVLVMILVGLSLPFSVILYRDRGRVRGGKKVVRYGRQNLPEGVPEQVRNPLER